MNIEELKLILETIQTISGDAQTFAAWWLIADKVLPLLLFVVVVALIYRIAIRVCLDVELTDVMKGWRDQLGIGGSYFCSKDRAATIKKISELVANNAKGQK